MPTYLYSPFFNEFRPSFILWQQAQLLHSKHPPYLIIRPNDPQTAMHGGRSLARCRYGDTLYLLAHGMPGTGLVASHEDPQPGSQFMNAPTLAQHLEEQGLSPSIALRIKVWACGSALGGNGVPPFAQDLRDQMRNRGYYSVTFFGYAGDLSLTYLTVEREDGSYTTTKNIEFEGREGVHRASTGRVRF